MLLGRRWELTGLAELLAEARSGHGRGVLVLGDAGIGKTTLVEALAERADGFTVVRGRCPEVEATVYWPWRQALQTLGAPEALTAARPERTSVFADVAEALTRTTADSPVLLVLEDVHWADAASLALLQFVVAVLPELRCVLVLTSRDNAVDVGPEAARALEALPPVIARLTLSGLRPDETAALVEQVLGHADPELAGAVHERARGNPFFVQELARLHAARGGGLGPPAGVQQVLGRRLARLRQDTSDCLSAAAVLGDDVDLTVLAEVGELPVQAVLDAAAEAAQARLAELAGTRLSFAHALVREVLYAATPAARRGHLHGRAAEVLAQHGADPAIVAQHYRQAVGHPEAGELAAAFAVRAGEEATRRTGYEDAVRYYRWAAEGGLDVRLRLGAAQVLAGELAAGREVLRLLARESVDAGDADTAAQALLAMGGGPGGFEVDLDDAEQAALLEQALPLLDDGPTKAAVLARAALARAYGRNDASVREVAQSAIDMAARFGDVRIEAAAIAAWCDTAAGPEHVAERRVRAQRMVALADAAADPAIVLLARRLLVVALLELGEFAAADEQIAAYAATAGRLHAPFYTWPVPIWQGMRALMRGDLNVVDECLAQAGDLARRARSTNAELMVFSLQMRVADLSDTMREHVGLIDATMSPYRDVPMAQGYLAYYLTRAGEHERAAGLVAQRMAAGLDAIPRDAEWLTCITLFGEAGRLLGDRAAVDACTRAIAPYRERWIYDGVGAACYGQVAHYLDRFADFLGTAPAVRRTVSVGELRRSGGVWSLRWRGEAATVSDAKGVRDLAALLSRPRTPIHVLDLVDAPRTGADTGPVLDAQARAAYTARLRDLAEELDEAEQFGDAGRAERLRGEQEFLARELAAALGLGARARRSGDPVERARKAVSMRITAAIKAIDLVHPPLARHLRASVHTGRHCVYEPEDDVTWHT